MVEMVKSSSIMSIPKPSTASCSPMQRSFSIDSHKPRRLSHGCQMDLSQAVQLEKQELCKLGHLFNAEEMPLPKSVSLEDESQPPYWLSRQRRAASFSSGQKVPIQCSPPVSIPEAPRRYSEDHTTLQIVSKTQCEARLWDEFWNYKLSFESRESFEASNLSLTDVNQSLKLRSESSTDTVNEDEDARSVEPEEDMFEMDDL